VVKKLIQQNIYLVDNLELKIGLDLETFLRQEFLNYSSHRVLKKSVDARRRHEPHFVYKLHVAENGAPLPDDKIILEKTNLNKKIQKPLIVGTGPAGLFAALRFVEKGIPCVLFERGSLAEKRIMGINRFWRYGELDERNNVCFGEGGAGLYSDGKLITRIKSPHIPYVLDRLAQFGAPEEIKYLSNPHVGSDKIRRVIPKLRAFLVSNNCEIHFDTQVQKFIYNKNCITGLITEKNEKFHSDHIVLATGHSAEDMLSHLYESGVHLEGKSFAMGLRIEHSQKLINSIQYRQYSENEALGSANYKLTYHDEKENVGVYSFCMCPGGYVLSSGTSKEHLVCNGMSNFNRNSPFANAAIVVSIDEQKYYKDDLLGGLKMRSQIEHAAWKSVQLLGGTKQLPAQKLIDFLKDKKSEKLNPGSSPSGAISVNLNELLPDFLSKKLKEGFEKFDHKMSGFINENAVLYGVETRTSCPIRVTRNSETLESLSHRGLYPCGEGAGYAGGITSAACDGVRVAEQIIKNISNLS